MKESEILSLKWQVNTNTDFNLGACLLFWQKSKDTLNVHHSYQREHSQTKWDSRTFFTDFDEHVFFLFMHAYGWSSCSKDTTWTRPCWLNSTFNNKEVFKSAHKKRKCEHLQWKLDTLHVLIKIMWYNWKLVVFPVDGTRKKKPWCD